MPVEVVRRLIEQDDLVVGPAQADQRSEDGLPTGQRPDAPGELDPVQPGGGEVGETSVADVPVVTDRIEVSRVGAAVLDPGQGIEDRADAEEVGDSGVGVQGESLRQVAHRSGNGQLPGGGGQFTGEDAQQRGLARPVRAGQTGASGREGGSEMVEDRCAVRPGEGEVVEDDGVLRGFRG